MKILLKNKKASFNYTLHDKFYGGIELFGFEVKSLKNKKGSFEGSFISVSNTDETKKLLNKSGKNEVFLKNFFIPPYQEKNCPKKYDTYRNRKILLKRKEILEIEKKTRISRLTIIPICIFSDDKNLIKIEFALASGKKKFDKREVIKKRQANISDQRNMKI